MTKPKTLTTHNSSPAGKAIGANDITGVILAGGQGSRLGGQDKGLIELHGQLMAQRVIARLAPQVDSILISANRNLERYAALGHRVVCDTMSGYPGPLAGIASALQVVTTPYVAIVPCDSPLFGPDLVARLAATLVQEQAEISAVHDGERAYPVFALMACRLLPSLLQFLEAGERKVDRWFAQHNSVYADFSDHRDWFININDRLEHQAVETRLRQVESC